MIVLGATEVLFTALKASNKAAIERRIAGNIVFIG
jgi:hypothetical protein